MKKRGSMTSILLGLCLAWDMVLVVVLLLCDDGWCLGKGRPGEWSACVFDEVKRERESQNEPTSQGDLACVDSMRTWCGVLVPVRVCGAATTRETRMAFPSPSSPAEALLISNWASLL